MRFLRDAAVTILILVVVGGVVGYAFVRNGLSARTEPSRLESLLARRLRHLAIPTAAEQQKNPFAGQADTWRVGSLFFGDHCAVCHNDDGRGKSEIGQNLFPRVPDLTQPDTQQLSDGELYHIIANGIRYTGMPAWGSEQKAEDTWREVSFIRRLASPQPSVPSPQS